MISSLQTTLWVHQDHMIPFTKTYDVVDGGAILLPESVTRLFSNTSQHKTISGHVLR